MLGRVATDTPCLVAVQRANSELAAAAQIFNETLGWRIGDRQREAICHEHVLDRMQRLAEVALAQQQVVPTHGDGVDVPAHAATARDANGSDMQSS